MRALGAYVRVLSKRYCVGFAAVDGTQLVDTDVFPAPADRDEPGQLAELHLRVYDLIGEFNPDVFALKVYEQQARSTATIAGRAEGVVLGAASRRTALAVEMWTRQRLSTPAGLQKGGREEIVDALCARLDSQPADDECRQAAAGALGALIVRGAV